MKQILQDASVNQKMMNLEILVLPTKDVIKMEFVLMVSIILFYLFQYLWKIYYIWFINKITKLYLTFLYKVITDFTLNYLYICFQFVLLMKLILLDASVSLKMMNLEILVSLTKVVIKMEFVLMVSILLFYVFKF